MSFSGFYQILCSKGHYWTEDCYVADNEGTVDGEGVCSFCGSPVAWWDMVDTTNDAGEPTILELYEYAKHCTCDKCGDTHKISPDIFKIPKDKGHRIDENE